MGHVGPDARLEPPGGVGVGHVDRVAGRCRAGRRRVGVVVGDAAVAAARGPRTGRRTGRVRRSGGARRRRRSMWNRSKNRLSPALHPISMRASGRSKRSADEREGRQQRRPSGRPRWSGWPGSRAGRPAPRGGSSTTSRNSGHGSGSSGLAAVRSRPRSGGPAAGRARSRVSSRTQSRNSTAANGERLWRAHERRDPRLGGDAAGQVLVQRAVARGTRCRPASGRCRRAWRRRRPPSGRARSPNGSSLGGSRAARSGTGSDGGGGGASGTGAG